MARLFKGAKRIPESFDYIRKLVTVPSKDIVALKLIYAEVKLDEKKLSDEIKLPSVNDKNWRDAMRSFLLVAVVLHVRKGGGAFSDLVGKLKRDHWKDSRATLDGKIKEVLQQLASLTPAENGKAEVGTPYTAMPRFNGVQSIPDTARYPDMTPYMPIPAKFVTGTQQTGQPSLVPNKPIAKALPPFDLASAKRADITTLTASDIVNATGAISAGGSHGAMFLLCDKGCFFLKAEADSFNEKFTADLFRSLPVVVPAIRVLAQNQWSSAITFLADGTTGSTQLLGKELRKYPNFMIQEVLQGANATKGLAFGKNPLDGPGARTRLFIIGMMVAYDLVIDNCDRFPRVVSKHDNMANLMFSRLSGLGSGADVTRPSAIDQQVSQWSHGELNSLDQRYHIDLLLDAVLSDLKVREELARAVVDAFKRNNYTTLPLDAVNAVRDGITEGLAKLARDDELALKELLDRMITAQGGESRQAKILTQAVKLLALKYDDLIAATPQVKSQVGQPM